jgi:hypothetical protein
VSTHRNTRQKYRKFAEDIEKVGDTPDRQLARKHTQQNQLCQAGSYLAAKLAQSAIMTAA